MELSFIRVTWPKAIYRLVCLSEWPPTSITPTGNYCDLLTMTLFPGLISLLLSITFSVSTLIGAQALPNGSETSLGSVDLLWGDWTHVQSVDMVDGAYGSFGYNTSKAHMVAVYALAMNGPNPEKVFELVAYEHVGKWKGSPSKANSLSIGEATSSSTMMVPFASRPFVYHC